MSALVNTVRDYKEVLRQGEFAWPGGYQCYLLMSDGEALCYACGRKEFRNVISSIKHTQNDGWRCIGADINYEETELVCTHCSKPIPAAYGGVT